MKQRVLAVITMLIMMIGTALPAQAMDFSLAELRVGIADLNDECPVDCGDGMYIALVELDDETMTLDYYFYTTEEEMGVEMIRLLKDELSEVLLNTLINPEDKDQKDLINALRKYGYGITLTFFNDEDDSVTIVYLPEEI